ncbi:MAG: ABC transporter ATP-binding protein [Nitrososphaerota archaeon]|nr:ABC transporter ATP-binding protein [Nitrososphaerota archaeon]
MLRVETVSSGYGKLQILNEVSLEADEGRVTVVVGPNGSGKSTLLKTIAGLTNIYHGAVTLNGETISKLQPHEIARKGLAYLPQTESTFTQLTVAENIKMAAYMVRASDAPGRLGTALEMFPQISKYMGTKVQSLSGGERQMVAMAMALMRKPTVMMFDEPTANLSPKLALQVLRTVESFAKERGITVVLVEQNARRALEIGDRAYLLVGGKNTFSGPASELLAHKELAQLYLGLKVA